MAEKNSWHRYDMKKLRHGHPMYRPNEAGTRTSFIMVALCNRADHYIFAL